MAFSKYTASLLPKMSGWVQGAKVNLYSIVSVVLGTTSLAYITYQVLKLWRLYLVNNSIEKELKKYFKGPTPKFLTGNKHEIARGMGIMKVIEWTQMYGSPFIMYHGPFWVELVISDPEHIKTICNSSEPKEPMGYDFMKPWLGDGLLISKGQKWARNRRLLTPAFHFEILRPYQEVFSGCANTLVSKWQKTLCGVEGPIEMFESISLMTLDSLMRCIFGINSNFQTEMSQNPYIKAVHGLSDLTISRFRYPPYYSNLLFSLSYSGFKYRKTSAFVHKFSSKVIEERKEMKKNDKNLNNRKYRDFLDMLLDCRDSDGQGLTTQEIQDEVDTFMFEGHDTTASGISWCLYNLACHPHYQQQCRDEVNRVLRDHHDITWDDLSNMPYLTMCIKESLRLRPPVTAIARRMTKEYIFSDGRKIPEDAWVGINIYACHHNPQVWPQPEVFDPERFNTEINKNRHSHAFIPFSAGPRNCIGQNFAMNELKTCVGILLRHFEFLQDGCRLPQMSTDLVLRAKEPGLWLRLKPIEQT